MSHNPKSYAHYLKTITVLRKQISVLGFLEEGEKKEISEGLPQGLDNFQKEFFAHLSEIEVFIKNVQDITLSSAEEIICSEENFPIFCADILHEKEQYSSEKADIENTKTLFNKLVLTILDKEYIEKYIQHFSPLRNSTQEALFALENFCDHPEISDFFDTKIQSYTDIEKNSNSVFQEILKVLVDAFTSERGREKNKKETVQKKISALVYVFVKQIINTNSKNRDLSTIFINRLSQQNIVFDEKQILEIVKNIPFEKKYPEISGF